MNSEPITAKRLTEINICGVTPRVVENGLKMGAYNFLIKPGSGGIGDVMLFVNGNHLKSFALSQLKKNNDGYLLTIPQEDLKHSIVDGTNFIEVKATTADRTLQSRRGAIEIESKQANTAPVKLYAINVGISKYKGEKLNLAYASKDAEGFASTLKRSAEKLLNSGSSQRVYSYLFSTTASNRDQKSLLAGPPSDNASWPAKENIKKAFQEIAEKASANDILVLFFAGHGILNNATKEFYFLTSEASTFDLTGVEKEVAISTAELNEWMRNIKAQKQVLILDACSSGQAVNNLQELIAKREIPADQQRALERLKDRTGTYILSASASGQSAYETSLYGQGLLTYSLLSGIKFGNALRDDKFLDVTTWFNYAADEVKILAKDIGGRQDPKTFGNASFDVGIVDAEVKDAIPLTIRKKIFTRSRFIENEELLNDDLDIGSLVDKELTDVSARGNEKLVYIPNNTMIGGYSIRGKYEVKDDSIHVKVSLFKGQKDRIDQFEFDASIVKKDELAQKIVERVERSLDAER